MKHLSTPVAVMVQFFAVDNITVIICFFGESFLFKIDTENLHKDSCDHLTLVHESQTSM